LHNRGGNLLREQKQHANLQKSLAKLEKRLKACIDLWERECSEGGGGGGEFLVGGQPFLAYVQGQWAAFHQEKDREKLQKKARFGVAATGVRTSGKRRWLATLPTGAAKLQKLGRLYTANGMAWACARPPAATAKRTPRPPRTLWEEEEEEDHRIE